MSKKILCFFVILSLFFTICGCSRDSNSGNNLGEKEEEAEENEEAGNDKEGLVSVEKDELENSTTLVIKSGETYYPLRTAMQVPVSTGASYSSDTTIPNLKSGEQLISFNPDINELTVIKVNSIIPNVFPLVFSTNEQFGSSFVTQADEFHVSDPSNSGGALEGEIRKTSDGYSFEMNLDNETEIDTINNENYISFLSGCDWINTDGYTHYIKARTLNDKITFQGSQGTNFIEKTFEPKYTLYSGFSSNYSEPTDEELSEDTLSYEKTREDYFIFDTDSLENGYYLVETAEGCGELIKIDR